MIVQAEEMAKDVRIAVDMNHDSTPLLLEDDVDTVSFNDIIHAKLADAVRMVEMEAPPHLLEPGRRFGDAVTWLGDGKGWTLLPEDFMRLVVFKMSDWRYPVSEALTRDDPKYSRQWSRWKGVCGNPENPVVAVVNRVEGNVLEFFSCRDDTAAVEQATYVPLPAIGDDGGIEVGRLCYRAAVYRAAALALAAVGDARATTMAELSKALLAGRP